MPTTHSDLDLLVDLSLTSTSTSPTFFAFKESAVVERVELDPEDPVPSLFGRQVGAEISAVGVCAPATVSRATEFSDPPTDHTVVHVLHRTGVAITVLSDIPATRTFGPTTEPQHGRVPDACRRILDLPTPPPTETMTSFVVAAWLEVIARHALATPELSWDDIVTLHPACNSVMCPVTPSTLAEATSSLGGTLDWERFRKVIATVGGFPFGDAAKETAAWMDAGMFSRWAIDLLPTPADAFALLEAVLGPATFDRLWATVRLCE